MELLKLRITRLEDRKRYFLREAKKCSDSLEMLYEQMEKRKQELEKEERLNGLRRT